MQPSSDAHLPYMLPTVSRPSVKGGARRRDAPLAGLQSVLESTKGPFRIYKSEREKVMWDPDETVQDDENLEFDRKPI